MDHLSLWETILLGVVVLAVLLWISPGIKPMFEQSRKAKERDWVGFLIPITVVIFFVFLLIKLV